MKRSTIRLLAAVGLASPLMVSHAPVATAASANTTFAVQASVLSSCSVTALPLAFGVYSPTAASPVDASTTISVFCTLNSAYTLKLNVGTGGGTFTTRTLTDGSNTLNFNLYTTSARSSIWGDGTGSTVSVNGTGLGLLSASLHSVYGRLPAGQDAPAGSYASTITVTLEYT